MKQNLKKYDAIKKILGGKESDVKTVPKLNWKAPQMTHNSSNKLFKMTLRKIRKLDTLLQVLIGGIELMLLVTVTLDVGDIVHE